MEAAPNPRHPGAGVQDRREPGMNAEDLLAATRRLVEHPDAGTAGVWPRAAALLARQALELAIAGLWAGRPGWRPVRRDDAVTVAVPDRVRGPGLGDAGGLPVGRAQPRRSAPASTPAS
jgi:hypothetical protein